MNLGLPIASNVAKICWQMDGLVREGLGTILIRFQKTVTVEKVGKSCHKNLFSQLLVR